MTLEVSLRHAFGDFTLDVAFAAPPGITALFGRSGSGKTSVVNAVAGLLRPDHGRITLDGQTLADTAQRIFLPPHRRRIGYVFQEGRLFPHLTVRQNLGYGAWFAPRAARREDMGRVVEMLGIGHLLDRRPGALSGGEKSRVALGRALLSAPQIILADEPLAALDEARKAEILPYFERLRDEVAIPVLYVSHAAAEVARLATTMVVLDDGKMVAQGPTAAVMADPAALRSVGIREVAAVLPAVVAGAEDDGLTRLETATGPLFLPGIDAPPGTRLRVRILAHEVILSRARPAGLSAQNILPGIVTAVRPGDGPAVMVHLAIGGDEIVASITRRAAADLNLAPGDSAHAIVKSMSVARDHIAPAAMR